MDELCHYGIKGQKWGVRRFQNSDGSYTSEGKRRAQQQEKKDPVKEMKDEDLRKAITRLSLENKYKDLTKKPTPPSKLESTKKAVDATSELVNRAKKMDQDSRKAAKKERMDRQGASRPDQPRAFGTAVQRSVCQGVGVQRPPLSFRCA